MLGMVGIIVLVGSVGAATYAALVMTGVGLGGSGSAEPSPEPNFDQTRTNDERFRASNRDHLAICVQSAEANAGAETEAAATVRSALGEMDRFPLWETYELSTPQPEVVESCPYDSTLTDFLSQPAASPGRSENFGRQIRDGALPSRFRTFVYILPAYQVARITEVFGKPMSTEEFLCEDDFCKGVTNAIYVSLEARANRDLIQDLLADAIGLK
jgi:hypothetical protein